MKDFLKNLLLSLLVVSVMTLGMVTTSSAQVAFGINIGRRPRARAVIIVNQPPVCQYGYYDYEPYECAPYGFYGEGYFYNGVFLGVGPWGNWGYEHGWGGHRFEGEGGGQYRGQYRGHEYRGDRVRSHDNRGYRNSGHANERRDYRRR